MYDTAVIDRGLISKYNPKAWKLWILDWLSILLGDIIVTDTKNHADYWMSWPLISLLKKNKIKPLYLGVNDRLIFPISNDVKLKENKDFLVHFHGTYIPLQGVHVIIEAIKIAHSKISDIKWRLIGTGQTYSKITSLIQQYGLRDKIELIDRVPYEQLNILINDSTIVLGIFGETEKTNRVIPNKVYEGLAAKKIVITKDTPAIKEIFNNNELVCIANNPKDLADAIIKIYDNTAAYDAIKENGYQKIINNYTPGNIAENLLKMLE
ncbi:MAG: glycosyltransferase [Patescibacteria group bacterium]|nr:glycosyltransferase [Patescibacteria group bacterium]